MSPSRSFPILRTKLHRPPVPGDGVARERLHERLEGEPETPLTVVSAPAGYGKSTLVSGWAESLEHPCAWVSLDDTDSEPAAFLSYVLAAIRTVVPGACEETVALLAAPTLPPVAALARSLGNELDALDTPLAVVLDDYHRIAPASEVHGLLSLLLEHPPWDLRLVVISRRNPPLALSSLRAAGRLAEVRVRDLRFTGPETVELLEKGAGLSLSDDTLAHLDTEVEGWAVGLRLLLLALEHAESPEALLSGVTGGTPHVREYLVQEVLAGQTPQTREWLLQASILDRFCPELCEHVCGPGRDAGPQPYGGEAFVRSIREANLFVVALDADDRWFRYHHLFQDLLRRLLQSERGAEEVATLHARASAWLADRGLLDEALRHALESSDVKAAVRLVAEHRHELLNTEQWHRLKRWLALLPPDALTASPVLMSTMAYIQDYTGQVAESWAYRDRAEALLSTLPPDSPDHKAVEADPATLSAIRAFLSGEGRRALELTGRALALLPPEAKQIRTFAVGFRALAHQAMGDLAKAREVLDEALAERSPGRGVVEVRSNVYLCLVQMMAGSLDEVAKPARRSIELTKGGALPVSRASARYFLGVSHYLRNELPEAERELVGVLEDRYSLRTFTAVNGAAALACVYLAQGRTAEASRTAELAITQTAQSGDTLAHDTARAFAVDLAARQGRTAEARRLSRAAEFEPFPPLYFFYVPQLTPVKLLLAERTAEGLTQAAALLDPLEEFLRKTHRTTVLIDVLALQALVLDAQSALPPALETLAEALALAEPGGIVRSFLDLGPPMADLLRRLPEGSDNPAFVERVLSAFGDADVAAAEPARPLPASQPLVEPLSHRELDVLELLAERYRDKEIAEKLCISPQTVKSHLKNVYQKLAVTGRRPAIARATELGLLVTR